MPFFEGARDVRNVECDFTDVRGNFISHGTFVDISGRLQDQTVPDNTQVHIAGWDPTVDCISKLDTAPGSAGASNEPHSTSMSHRDAAPAGDGGSVNEVAVEHQIGSRDKRNGKEGGESESLQADADTDPPPYSPSWQIHNPEKQAADVVRPREWWAARFLKFLHRRCRWSATGFLRVFGRSNTGTRVV